LYEFFHHRIGKLAPCAHLLIVGRAVKTQSVAAATQEALSGFVRSLAKELGGRGITINLLLLPASGEHISLTNLGVNGVIRYLLSDHGSFVTGQVLHLQDRQRLSAEPQLQQLQRFENLLEGHTILVTGAAQGIGAAIARRVAAEGAKVLLLDRPEELKALEAMAREVQGLAMPIDLLQPDAVVTTVKKLRELAPIHGVVHNAGITRDKTLFKMNRQKWDSVLRLNFEIPVAITEMVTGKDHDFICAKDASFVYLSSVGGIAGNPGQTNYAASKAGLIGYVRALASAQDNNSAHVARGRFNCVAPGFIETRMTEAMPLAVREVARRFNSLKQAGEADDVAQAVTFLLSDAAMAINGETLRVCGQNFVGQ
jgi:3-oxoacyl-[acyl-carrier protein] reductase